MSENAVSFEKGNIQDLREKLQMLCEDKEKVSSYKIAAPDYICNKYSWDDVVKRTLKLYQE